MSVERAKVDAQAWHAEPVHAVLEKLATQHEHGLSTEEASGRLERYGYNELRGRPPTPFWRLVVDQLKNFVVMLLIAASVISFALGDRIEAAAIIAIVILNAIIGVVQESRAEASLAALKKLAAPEARVIRNGSRFDIPGRELVPGDLVLVEAGNFIPADLRLVESVNLRIEEAALTGESVPVEKRAALVLEREIPLGDRRNSAFMGTLVSYGRGTGVVVATGHTTQIGLIADMLSAVEEEETPLQKWLDGLSRTLSIAALAIVAIVFGVGLLQGEALLEMFILAVSLAIAAVPEGLPAVVTISLALGMREMVKRHALMRRLSAVETLGSASVICSDKTGTLTQNEMTAVRLWCDDELFEITGDGYRPEGEFLREGDHLDFSHRPATTSVLWAGLLANDAILEVSGKSEGQSTYRMIGDPTEGALVVAAAKAGAWRKTVEASFPRVAENPFDSDRKMMSTLHEVRDMSPGFSPLRDGFAPAFVVCAKGAPDVILTTCSRYQQRNDQDAPITPEFRKAVLAANAELSSQALRVLAVAYRPFDIQPEPMTPETVERDLIFVGLIGMIDQARPEVKPAIQRARGAGIRTVMITGDYLDTARAIAETIGLLRPGRKVLLGSALDEMTEDEVAEAVRETDVFARVSPAHKVMIVDALQRNGEVAAMTGDGVNDAPALKKADIGVAMGITGTDVAKEAADMVLTDDNYASIVAAVEQGRVIYANIRKFVFFLLSCNVAEIMIIFLATLAGLPHPLTAVQLLWLNLITDGAPALALAMEKGDPDVMEHPPRPKNEPIINRSMQLGIVVMTIAETGAVLGAFAIGLLSDLGAAGALPAGVNPVAFLIHYDWRGVDVQTAKTMAFTTLTLCELFRAYTVRSERVSIFRLGIFSNRYMQYAVAFSLLLLLVVINVPYLQPLFNTTFLSPSEWGTVISLALLPAIVAELTKAYLRWSDKKVRVDAERPSGSSPHLAAWRSLAR